MTIATCKILLVDDSESDIETYRRYLLRDKQRKYRILEARTGEEALLLCQQQFPDVIVIDYLLPDMDGLELLQELKAEFAKVCPPVIILTGQGNEQIAVQAMKGGAADYLVKKNTTQLNFIKAVENVLEKTQLSRQLEESEGRFQATFNQASVGIAYVGLEGQLLQVNQKLCYIVGYPREELLNLTLQEITHPDDRNIDLEYFVRLLSGEISTYSQEKRYIRQDYRQVWVNLTVSLVRKASGEPEYFICFVQDITQRKQLEADLRRRERQFSTLVENSPDIIFRLDRNLRHIYISPQVVRESGIPTEEFLGKTGRELGLPPDACDLFEAACQEALTTGRLTGVEYSIGDKQYVSRLIPEAAADGTVESLMGITEDITERKQVEERLQTYATELEELYNNAPCGYHSVDKDGIFLRINDTELKMLGYSREEVLGKMKVSDILTPESLITFQQNFPRFQQRGWVRDLEFQWIRKDGTILTISLSATAIKNTAGNFLFSRSIVVDISDRKQLEAERQAAQANLRISEERYRLMFENNPNPMWFYDPDTLAFLEVNQAAIAHYGYSREEFLQMTIADIRLPTDVPALHRTNNHLVPGQPHVGIWQHCKKDGSIIDVEVTAYAFPVAGKQVNLVLIKDITDRKQAEAALRESEKRLKLSLEASLAGTWSWDIANNTLTWDDRIHEIYGFAVNAPRSYETWLSGVHPDDRALLVERMTQLFETIGNDLWNQEFRILHPSVGERWVMGLGRVERDATGRVILFTGLNFDITERKHREANATFLAEVAEDLSRLSSADEIIQAVGAKIGAYLNVTTCNFCEVDEQRDEVIYLGRWQTEGAFCLPDRIRLSEQVSEDFLRRVHAGETIVSNNTQTNPVTNAQANAEIGALSFITVPFHNDGEWKYLFSIHDIINRTWGADEIELVRELANRTFPRLERARAEAATAEDLKDTQLLRDLSVRLISEDDIQVLYDEIVTTAIALMHSDMGSLQILERSRNELYLQSCRGFHPDAVAFWSTVRVNEGSVCSMALQQGEQIIIPDIETCDVMSGTVALDYYRLCGVTAVQSTPLISRSGQVIGMFSTHWCQPYQPSDRQLRFLDLLARQAADLIEQRQDQEKIREQAALLDVTTDAIFVRDLENCISYWNAGAEHLYGWQAAEVLGRNCHEFLCKEITPGVEEACRTVLEQGEWQGELNKITKSGKGITVQSRWTLMCDEVRQPKSILVVDTDITEKKQLEAQFYRAQRLESLGTLASGIAHDLNNILTPILTVAQLLQMKFPTLEVQNRQLLKILEDNSKRGAEIVKQITAFARGAEGKRVALQPRHLIKEIARIVNSTFPKSIEISTNITAVNLWTVSADPTQIHQVLMNLCVNARDAMPDGGRLRISADNFRVDDNYAKMNLEAKVGDYVAIAVSDTGCGMSPEVLERIFEPFFTTKETGKGTGLGLSTVIGIIKNHDGFVNVQSQVGEGSQFQVFLPAIETVAIELDEDSQIARGNGELILIVDDEALVRDVAKTSLEVFNYRVLTASDSIEAFSLYAQYQNEISLVLMDIQMPSMDGLNVIRVLQRMNPAVKIIAISGLASNRQLLEARGIEVQGFLPKPYTMKELLDTIQGILSLT